MASSKNERNTENIVRDELRELDYFSTTNDVRIEEQKSTIDAVKRLLKSGSKSGGTGSGAPEFIISSEHNPDFLLIIECKASTKDHISSVCKSLLQGDEVEEEPEAIAKRVQRFAVDGVLHYAAKLSKDFNVIAVAVSGEKKGSTEFSAFLYPKGATPKPFITKDKVEIVRLLSWDDIIEHATFDPMVQRLRFEELMSFSRELHDFMRDHAKLTESQKPLLVSGTLIALRHKPFRNSYNDYSPGELQKQWMHVIRDEIERAKLPQAKSDSMTQPFSGIAVHPELGKATKFYPRGVLHELIRRLDEKVWPFISIYHDFDVVGQFYGEFLKYTGGDKKALGIVLTPRHITELFALLANVQKDTKVLDICAGTAGFLISAMHQMIRAALTEPERDHIRKHGLIGVEQQPDMFTLAASNMILRGDGKANLYQGSCFDAAITAAVKKHHCTVGLLNPPFSQGDADLHELYFIKHLLDCLSKSATAVVIVPMSCAISPHPAKTELLKHHTLEAVMSMPDDLFYPVGTVTCIMVFTAKVPHEVSGKKTWFGYWKNDGFVKTKKHGRVDLHHNWPNLRDRWVQMFKDREVHAGESVMQKVTAQDEWCAEAYMETDYSKIGQDDFEHTVRSYAIFKLLSKAPVPETESEEESA